MWEPAGLPATGPVDQAPRRVLVTSPGTAGPGRGRGPHWPRVQVPPGKVITQAGALLPATGGATSSGQVRSGQDRMTQGRANPCLRHRLSMRQVGLDSSSGSGSGKSVRKPGSVRHVQVPPWALGLRQRLPVLRDSTPRGLSRLQGPGEVRFLQQTSLFVTETSTNPASEVPTAPGACPGRHLDDPHVPSFTSVPPTDASLRG